MPKNLVIVESPAKANTIEKYLGKDFHVLASVGHIRKDTKVDKSTFDVTYEIDPGHTKIISDLKKAAKVAGAKKAEMIPMKDLLGVTGYIRGGCSPIGMKKPFPTYFHSTALDYTDIYVSAGVRGLQIRIAPQTLITFCNATAADIAVEK